MVDPSDEITLRDYHQAFEHIERPFKEYWANGGDYHYGPKEKHWERVLELIKEYTRIERGLIPKKHTRCLVETKQEYEDFTLEEILHYLEGLSQLASLMYCAERDVLRGSHVLDPRKDYPLEGRYVSALESIVWEVASFTQSGGFTDLITRLKEIYEPRIKGDSK